MKGRSRAPQGEWDGANSPFDLIYVRFLQRLGVGCATETEVRRGWRGLGMEAFYLGQYAGETLQYRPDIHLHSGLGWVEQKRHWGEVGLEGLKDRRTGSREKQIVREKCRRLSMLTREPVYLMVHAVHDPLVYPQYGCGVGGKQYRYGGHLPPDRCHYAWFPDGSFETEHWWCICPFCAKPGITHRGATCLLRCGCVTREARTNPDLSLDYLHSFNNEVLLTAYAHAEAMCGSIPDQNCRYERHAKERLLPILSRILTDVFGVRRGIGSITDAEGALRKHIEWLPSLREILCCQVAVAEDQWKGAISLVDSMLERLGQRDCCVQECRALQRQLAHHRDALRFSPYFYDPSGRKPARDLRALIDHWFAFITRDDGREERIRMMDILPRHGESSLDACNRLVAAHAKQW